MVTMESELPISHVAFSDESHWNKGRYRSISLITMPYSFNVEYEQTVKKILNEIHISEFKWTNLSGVKEREAAVKMCDFIVENASKGFLRLDVLIWDIEDSRHKIPGRDDIANLQRMYYKLFKHVLSNRWPDGSTWILCPDEHSAMDWNNVKNYLEKVDTKVEIYQNLFTGGKFELSLKKEFKIYKINPLSSACNPWLQIADLFAGLAVFSREQYSTYSQWLKEQEKQKGQFSLFDFEENNKISRSSQERCYVLYHFHKLCKDRKLGVSLRTCEGLLTFCNWKPINFWLYRPQHLKDKAPKKK